MFGESAESNGTPVYNAYFDREEGIVLGNSYRSRLQQAEDSGASTSFPGMAQVRGSVRWPLLAEFAADFLSEATDTVIDYRDELEVVKAVFGANYIPGHKSATLDLPIPVDRQMEVAKRMVNQMWEEKNVLELRAEDLQPEHFM